MVQYKKVQFEHRGEMVAFSMEAPLGPALEAGFFHEQYTSLTFLELLRPGDTVVDIGASVGYYSLLSFTAMRGQGRIISFEPNPFSFVRLIRHIAVNKASCITAFNVAASDAVGTARILAHTGDSGLSRVLTEDEHTVAKDTDNIVSCATMRLDDLIEDLGVADIRLLKIDAEGHEKHVMDGASRVLSRRIPEYVVCEINRGELERNGFSETALRKTFEDYGYVTELINAIGVDLCEGRMRRPYSLPELVQTDVVFNILFRRA